jgi:hypothetical protein
MPKTIFVGGDKINIRTFVREYLEAEGFCVVIIANAPALWRRNCAGVRGRAHRDRSGFG